MGRRLDRISVSGFKSIRQMDLDLQALNILIGANGSGKSNFVSVFKLLNQITEKNLQFHVASSGGADVFLHFGKKVTSQIAIDLSFAYHTNGYKCVLTPTAQDELIFQYEECWFLGTTYVNPLGVTLGRGHKETKLVDPPRGRKIAEYVLEDLRSWKIYHFQDTSDSARVKQTGDLEDNRFLRPDAGNLAAFLYRLRETHPSHYANVVEGTRMVAPFFDDFSLEPSRLNPDKIRLEWREKGSDTYFNASALSDGTLRFICLATLLLQPFCPSTVLLDEPELGLHPYAINVLAELLRGAATKTQVVVSTQSVTLVNQFDPEDLIVVEREDGQSVFRHLEKAQMQTWLDDYGLGELWEKNVIGGRP